MKEASTGARAHSRSFMRGSISAAVVSFFEKVFVYGSLIWLLMRTGMGWVWATAAAASMVMVLRMIQVYLPNRSAEITDVLMVLILAGILRLTSRPIQNTPAEPA